jgi:hypothetical protein
MTGCANGRPGLPGDQGADHPVSLAGLGMCWLAAGGAGSWLGRDREIVAGLKERKGA